MLKWLVTQGRSLPRIKVSWQQLAVAGWVLAVLAVICVRRVSADFGWHYRSGQYIAEHGVPQHDVFTYTARDFAWVNHEWLNDLLTYALVHWWGYMAAGLVFAGIWFAALMAAARWRMSLVPAGLALGALWDYVGVRPEAWTALGLALTLRLLEEKGRRRWWLVPLFAVWANLHAGFAVGLVMVALKAVLTRSWRLAALMAAAAVAVLVNPFGVGVYVELWRTLSDGRLGGVVAEWAPLSVTVAAMPYVLAVVAALIVVRKRNFEWWRSLGLVVAAIWSNRQVPLLVVGSLGLVGSQIDRVWGEIEKLVRKSKWVQVAVGMVVGVGFPVSLWLWPANSSSGVSLLRPASELVALRNQPCAGRVFNDYNYGGQMIQWLPGVPVYIDGRMPSWRGPRGRYLDLYEQVMEGGKFADQEFARYGVKCALLSRADQKLSAHLASRPDWRLELRADDAQLWRVK